MDRFHISFREPLHGWMPVDVVLDGESCAFAASNVLNDPVQELAVAALHLIRHSHVASVNWWLEPDWHVLSFDSTMEHATTHVALDCFTDGRALASTQQQYDTVIPTVRLCRNIGLALRNLVHECGRDIYESRDGWNRAFPEDTIAEMYSELRHSIANPR